ncbi:uncharacterized protein EDB91DRAFT_1267269 [Suillus paluster]|uniref:uncharacterized protein n=1 Tax=Suillus paluster TaxID=48578 RepID=UPI001B863518|nr:uncharacterized protein EDB91DRAFT_1267269 [Suillus paluster]KAG1746684.1 hypothetical protein EDB91DRAFT_1267269 [Suillus paluster]
MASLRNTSKTSREEILSDLLCVPVKFCAIVPSRTLSVTQLLVFNFPTNLETNPSFPAFSMATALRDRATSAWQDRDQSVMHPSFPNDPLPLWVLSYWVSMSHALEHHSDWRASHNWILDRLDTVLGDCAELETIDDILDVIERLPWDVPLKGVGAWTDLSTSGLRLLLASGPIGGHIMDTMIAAVVERMQASENRDLRTVCVESLILMDTLQLNEKRNTSACPLSYSIFTDIHWAAIEVNVIDQTISYADSLGWSWPTHDIDTIRHWLGRHGLSGFSNANALQCGQQLDSFSCGIAAINTIKHAVFCDPLFDDNGAFSLCMEEFLGLAYDHLELSVPGDGMDICNGSDVDDASDFEPEETSSGAESEHDLEVEETQPSIPTQPSSTQTNKPKLDLHTTDADQNKGLFKFFPKVSHEEHLQRAWKPFAWELRDQERDHYQQEFNKFEKATRKLNLPSIPFFMIAILSHQPVTIAEASCPYRQLQRHARSKHTRNLGWKRKWEDTDALRVNWQSPLLWPTIEMAALHVGYGMSPVQIERELKRIDPTRFGGIHAQVIGSWIDHSRT